MCGWLRSRTVFRLNNVASARMNQLNRITYWFIHPFMVQNKIFVLLPCCDEIIRDSMEYFAVDFGLELGVNTDTPQTGQRNKRYVPHTPTKHPSKMCPKRDPQIHKDQPGA
jgi:hypothetical protein